MMKKLSDLDLRNDLAKSLHSNVDISSPNPNKSDLSFMDWLEHI